VAKAGTFAASQVLTAAELNAGAGAGTSWTPSYSNLTIGNGTVSATYGYYGRRYFVSWILTLGSTSSVGSVPVLSGLPVAAANGEMLRAAAWLRDASTGAVSFGVTIPVSSTSAQIYAAGPVAISSTSPWTWATSDTMSIFFTYEGTS
jgi:hypothetical protein